MEVFMVFVLLLEQRQSPLNLTFSSYINISTCQCTGGTSFHRYDKRYEVTRSLTRLWAFVRFTHSINAHVVAELEMGKQTEQRNAYTCDIQVIVDEKYRKKYVVG
jgi:hypothetical protein